MKEMKDHECLGPVTGDKCATLQAPSVHKEKLAQSLSCHRLLARYVADYLVLIENPPDRRQEFRQFPGKLLTTFSSVSEQRQLFADQVVERALRTKPSTDFRRCPALLDPDLMELHIGYYIAMCWPDAKRLR